MSTSNSLLSVTLDDLDREDTAIKQGLSRVARVTGESQQSVDDLWAVLDASVDIDELMDLSIDDL